MNRPADDAYVADFLAIHSLQWCSNSLRWESTSGEA
jgi:hypothetical protein